jgi:hypothetical protein
METLMEDAFCIAAAAASAISLAAALAEAFLAASPRKLGWIAVFLMGRPGPAFLLEAGSGVFPLGGATSIRRAVQTRASRAGLQGISRTVRSSAEAVRTSTKIKSTKLVKLAGKKRRGCCQPRRQSWVVQAPHLSTQYSVEGYYLRGSPFSSFQRGRASGVTSRCTPLVTSLCKSYATSSYSRHQSTALFRAHTAFLSLPLSLPLSPLPPASLTLSLFRNCAAQTRQHS